jgi:hypothetical protein
MCLHLNQSSYTIRGFCLELLSQEPHQEDRCPYGGRGIQSSSTDRLRFKEHSDVVTEARLLLRGSWTLLPNRYTARRTINPPGTTFEALPSWVEPKAACRTVPKSTGCARWVQIWRQTQCVCCELTKEIPPHEER